MPDTTETPGIISIEALFDSPTRAYASISPDGTRIAYLAPWKDRLNVWVQSVDSQGEDDARCVTADDNRSVLDYHWTDDPRWLLYTQDDNGDENWHVYRVDLDEPDAPVVDLTPFPGAKAYVELLAGCPGKAFVGLNKRDVALFDAYELDIATGALTLLAENPGNGASWFAGRNGELFALAVTAEGDVELSSRDAATGALRSIAVYDGGDYTLGVFPIVVTPDGKGLWVGSNQHADRTTVVRLDVATGEETDVDSHPTFSVDPRAQVWPTFPSPLIVSRRTGELVGVRYLGERQVIHALEPHFAEVLANLEQLSDGDLTVMSCDDSEQRWVASFNHDREPGLTYFYDHATKQSRLLFRPRPDLDPGTLAPMTPVTITSRDGLDLHSYLTLPWESSRNGCRSSFSCTVARGRGTAGGSTPKLSFWPIAATRC